MKVRLWPYKFGSSGCKELQRALQAEGIDCLRVRTDGNYRPKGDHLIINWGNSCINPASWWLNARAGQILNFPDKVSIAANKLETFKKFERYALNNGVEDHYIRTPSWSTEQRPFATISLDRGLKIYCRTKLSGHSGTGIVVAHSVEELVDAPLYTVGINVKGEYRIHVFRQPDGNLAVIDVVKKRRRSDASDQGIINSDIRNLNGGWVYCHNNVVVTDETKDLAIKAIEALGLDFGAVDIVIEKDTEKPYVLEVNTAPGLSSPTTINAYVNAIKTYMEVH